MKYLNLHLPYKCLYVGFFAGYSHLWCSVVRFFALLEYADLLSMDARNGQKLKYLSRCLLSLLIRCWFWRRCHACRHMLPTFCNLSNEYDSALFIYADVDKCYETTRDVRYTPTFRFYRDGEKVDEFYGAGPQRLRDRVWLHT